MSKVKKNKLIKELEETLIKKGIEIDEISDVLKKIENNLKDKKYGLVWEEHTEEIEKELLTKFPILKEEKELRIEKENKGDSGDSKLTNNFLIEGDNLESLTALRNMGKKVDLIYIDPPYNILKGEEYLTYNDKRVDGEDNFRHSKWLSFMEKRLKLAKDLMSEEGVIFISIDEHEFSQLKMLCDRVLGELNFVENFIWVKNSTKNNSKTTSTNHEYIFCYSKNIKRIRDKNYFKVAKKGVHEVEKIRNDFIERNDLSREGLNKELEGVLRDFYKKNKGLKGVSNYRYVDTDLNIYRKDNTSSPGGRGGMYDVVHPLTGKVCKKPAGGWRYTEDTFKDLVRKNLIHFGDDEKTVPQYKRLLDTAGKEVVKSLIINSEDGQRVLMSMFEGGTSVFSNPKPCSLIKTLVNCIPRKNITILDFFAGSGTTGHAILELNKEDGGDRDFILCTNNENNICREVTYQRLNKVINGYTTSKGKEVEGIDANLTYLKTELIEKEEDLLDLGVDDTLKEVLVNNLKVTNNVTKVDELTEEIYKSEGSEEDYYLHFDFFVDDSIKKINISENKKNVVYVTEDNLTDVSLSMFDEVRSLNDLLVYK